MPKTNLIKKILTIMGIIWATMVLGQIDPGAYDCEFGVIVCGSVVLELEPEGIGFDEFSIPENIVPPCYSFNSNTIWVKFIIEEAGTLAFEITSVDGEADYDFAIYGPNRNCIDLGGAIRCSSTNPQNAMVPAVTGLNDTETDIFEGPGADGNGFLKQIDAASGDVYYMIIDRPHGDGGFTIEMTGTAVFPETPIAHDIEDIVTCDKDESLDEQVEIDLDALIPEILQGQLNAQVTFHKTNDHAFIDEQPLESPFLTRKFGQRIYYRVSNINSGCFEVNNFNVEVVSNVPITLPQNLVYCTNLEEPITLITRTGYYYYKWSTGEEGNNLNRIEVNAPGTYSVIATDGEGCRGMASTTILGSEAATIDHVEVQDFSQGNNSITIYASGSGNYQYGIEYQNYYQYQNVFTGFLNGIYTIYVRDTNGCGITSEEVIVLNYLKFMTPNQDGVHDTWNIKELQEFDEAEIHIFDRFGKIIYRIKSGSPGWDGTYNGTSMPSSDYWFLIRFANGREVRGHFALKR